MVKLINIFSSKKDSILAAFRIYQQLVRSNNVSYISTWLPKQLRDPHIRLLRIYKTIKQQIGEFNEQNVDGYVIVDNPVLSLLLTDPLPLPFEEYVLYLHSSFECVNFFVNARDNYSQDLRFILDNYDIAYADITQTRGLPTITLTT